MKISLTGSLSPQRIAGLPAIANDACWSALPNGPREPYFIPGDAPNANAVYPEWPFHELQTPPFENRVSRHGQPTKSPNVRIHGTLHSNPVIRHRLLQLE